MFRVLFLVLSLLFITSILKSQIRDSLNPSVFYKNTYVRFIDTSDSLLCNPDSISKKGGFYEILFTKKGNIIYAWNYKNKREDFYYGTYSVSSTGISYQLQNVYIIKPQKKNHKSIHDTDEANNQLDYTQGRIKKSKEKKYFIETNNCSQFPYARRNYWQGLIEKKNVIAINKMDGVPFGKVCEQNPRYEENFLRILEKITLFKDF